MGDSAHQGAQSVDVRDLFPGIEEREQFAFEAADAMLDGAVVARIVNGTVERQDAAFAEQTLQSLVIERTAIVALEQQGSAVSTQQAFQPADIGDS